MCRYSSGGERGIHRTHGGPFTPIAKQAGVRVYTGLLRSLPDMESGVVKPSKQHVLSPLLQLADWQGVSL